MKKNTGQAKEETVLPVVNLCDPLLSHIMEECFEVVVAAQHTDNIKLAEELGDVYSLFKIMVRKYPSVTLTLPTGEPGGFKPKDCRRELCERVASIGKHINKFQRFGPNRNNPKTGLPASTQISQALVGLAGCIDAANLTSGIEGVPFKDVVELQIKMRHSFHLRLYPVD